MLLGFFFLYLVFTGEWCIVWEQCNIFVPAWAKKIPHVFVKETCQQNVSIVTRLHTLARRSWQLATRSLFSIVRRAGLFFCFLLSLFSPHVAFCGHSDTLMAAKCSLGILFFFSYLCAACSPSICGFCYSDIGVLSQPFATHPDSSVCHPFARIRNAENLLVSANSAPVIESLGKEERPKGFTARLVRMWLTDWSNIVNNLMKQWIANHNPHHPMAKEL